MILGFAGCRAFEPVEQPLRIRPERPLWDGVELRRHLQFFNGEAIDGRATATQGYAQAAAYVAARLGEFGLKPLYANEFRVIYPTEVHYPLGATLYTFGVDTLQYFNGVDFIPDGRSASGTASVRHLVADPLGERADLADASTALIVRPQQATTAYLQTAQQAGGRLVMVVDSLAPRPAVRPLDDLVVLQVPAERMVPWLGTTMGRWGQVWQGQELRGWTLRGSLQAQVTASYEPAAGAINMVGFVSGKHPVHKQDLVVVCADLDAIGAFAGLRVLDTEHYGLGAAALLEVMRNVGHIARFYNVPERSILVAVWSGARQGHKGMEAFLRVPPWPTDRITSAIYIGSKPEEEALMRGLWEPYDIPFYTIPALTDTLLLSQQFVFPDPVLLRQALARPDSAEVPVLPLEEALVTNAVGLAERMAEEAYWKVLQQTMTDAPFTPPVPDSLTLPNDL